MSEYNKANRIQEVSSDDYSDSDFEPSIRKKPKIPTTNTEGILTKFSELNDKLTHIEKTIESSTSCSSGSSSAGSERSGIVVQKYESLKQCFVCVICKAYVSFPAVISKCCNVMLGCESCLAVWYEEKNTCPHCRNESSSGGLSNTQHIIVPALLPLQECLREAD